MRMVVPFKPLSALSAAALVIKHWPSFMIKLLVMSCRWALLSKVALLHKQQMLDNSKAAFHVLWM